MNTQGDRQLLAAGGSEDTADQDYSFMNFGGGYFGTNLFLLEGGYDVAQGWGGVLYVPAPEDTDQVKVTSYSFSAEYGFSTGNVISITTKAGTRDYHFLADEYIRNPDLDANLYFNNLDGVPKPDDHRNQFGFAGGGPLYIPGIYKQRDKTFFFANYEGLRLNGGLAPTAPMCLPLPRRAAISRRSSRPRHWVRIAWAGQSIKAQSTTPIRLGTCPDGEARSAIPIRETSFPRPELGRSTLWRINLLRETTGRRQRIQAADSTSTPRRAAATTSNEWGIRIDHNINAKNRIYGQFSNKHEGKVQTSAFYGANDVAGPYVFDPNNREFGVLGYSHVFSPTLILTSDLFFTRYAGGNVVQGYPFQPSSLGLPAQLDSWTPQFPQIQFGNTFSGSVTMLPWERHKTPAKLPFPQNNASLTIDVNKSFKAHSSRSAIWAFGKQTTAAD